MVLQKVLWLPYKHFYGLTSIQKKQKKAKKSRNLPEMLLQLQDLVLVLSKYHVTLTQLSFAVNLIHQTDARAPFDLIQALELIDTQRQKK